MNTTISISETVCNDIKEFGHKGETYDHILRRLLKTLREHQLRDLLFDDSDSVPVEEALEEARKKWRK